MKIINTEFKDLKIIKHKSYGDKRGFLRVVHNQKILKKKFVFEYATLSYKNSLRGFHFQRKFQQAKYVTVLKGKILDCVVDLRKNSKTFGKVFKIILSNKNNKTLFIPRGFAHAYYSYEKENIVYYKLDNFYSPKFEMGVNLFDKELKVKWPGKKFIVSKKDKKLDSFKSFKDKINFL